MKKAWNTIAKDLWIVLLDIVAVNLSYFLAYIIRFYVNGTLRPIAVSRYMPAFVGFAPYYTFFAIIVFIIFKLYGGMWRYAGINDLNRIILANVCTTIIYITGSIIFFTRMPITVYLIGGTLQLVFIVAIRFCYRVLLIEKKRIDNRRAPLSKAMIIGAGELGRKTVKNLEDSATFRPVCIIDLENEVQGMMIDGIPVVSELDDIESKIDKLKIQNVFIADNKLTSIRRNEIRSICENKGVIVQDYTGALSNQDDSISVTALLELALCPIVVRIDGEEFEFNNNREAQLELTDRYGILSINIRDDKLILELRRSQQVAFSLEEDQPVAYVGYDAWSKRK